MSERRISKVQPPQARTDAGKKVDTWRVELPDGHSQITVSMHTDPDGILFRAKGDHPCIRSLEWEGTDLTRMRNEVMEDVEKAARRYFETDWEPAVATEVKLYTSDRNDCRSVQVSFNVTDIHRDPNRPVGNRGETRILSGTTPTTLIQRGHNDVFEHGKSMSREDLMFSRENGDVASRCVTGDGNREDILALQSALESFSIKLMQRMAPDVVAGFGIPRPEHLVSLMQAALDDPENDPRDPDEFRM